MRLSAPKKSTFWISIVFCVLGVLGHFFVTALAPYAFWLVLVGAILLVLGCCVKDF